MPFDADAIAAALADEARGRRHFPSYRVRREQIELARAFARTLAQEEVLLAEGGTGVGKSLAYLAAAIPFAMQRDADGERGPILISTRTKLLQDQLVGRDIAAAARFLGYPIFDGWIALSLILYAVTGAFWIPVVFMQIRMRDLAEAAVRAGTVLPPAYHRLFWLWFAFGFPAFAAVLAILWLMTSRPVFSLS